ncbi:hypothetical protein ACFCP7_00335 [Paenibacillus elgii]
MIDATEEMAELLGRINDSLISIPHVTPLQRRELRLAAAQLRRYRIAEFNSLSYRIEKIAEILDEDREKSTSRLKRAVRKYLAAWGRVFNRLHVRGEKVK